MVTLQHELVATLAIADVIVGYDSMDSLIHVVEISESLNVQRIVVVVIIVIIIVVVIVVIVIITLIVIIIVIIVIIIVIVLVVTRLVIVAIIVIVPIIIIIVAILVIFVIFIIINLTLLESYYSFSHQFLTLHKITRCFACIRQLHSLQMPHICSSTHSTIQTPDRECVIVLETTPLRYKDFEKRQIYYDHNGPDPNPKTSRYTPFVCDLQMLPSP